MNIAELIEKIKVHTGHGLNFNRRRTKIDKSAVWHKTLIIIEFVLVIAFAWFITYSLCNKYTVMDHSMEDTLSYGDNVLADIMIYKVKSPSGNDVIAFYASDNVHSDIQIKRVIGVPGDTVLISRGLVYVNGEEYKDTIIADSIEYAGLADEEIVLSEDEYFVLGDNRNNSQDSRYQSTGIVTRDEIVGKIWIDISSDNFRLVY